MNTLNRRCFLATSSLAALAGPARALDPISRAGKARMKLSLAAYSMRSVLPNYRGKKDPGETKMDMAGFVDYCAGLDLDGAELTSYFLPDPCPAATITDLKRRAHVNGIDISGGAIGNNFAYPPDSAELKQQMDYTTRWIEWYAAMGAPVIRVFAGHPKKKGVDEKQAVANIITNLKTAGKIAGKHGVMLGIENHDFTTDIDRYLSVLEAVDSPWIGANLDTGNLKSYPDPYAQLARIAPYTVNAQFKVHIPVNGKKEAADLGKLVGILAEAGYRGYVVLEYEDQEDPFVAVPRYLEQLRKLLA